MSANWKKNVQKHENVMRAQIDIHSSMWQTQLNWNTVKSVRAHTFCIPLEFRCGTNDDDTRAAFDKSFTCLTCSFVLQSVLAVAEVEVVVTVRFGPIVSSHSSTMSAVEAIRFGLDWLYKTHDDAGCNINSSIWVDVFACDDRFE